MGTKRVAPTETTENTEPEAAAPKAARKAATPKSVASGETEKEKRNRRSFGGRNWLAKEIDAVLRAAPNGSTVPVKDIVAQVTNSAGEHPSSGAVAACLQRWADANYINVTAKPLAFRSFKSKATTLESFLDKERSRRSAERKAAREGAAV